ncbi:Midasin, partial [Bienertia sinuspersici]
HNGASNYRAWRRFFEIALASKRKLGFVTWGVKRDKNDKVKQECWDTCNNMVIYWILASVHDPIKKSVMMRIYSLKKQLYETKQQGKPASEYYNIMKGIWMELDSLNMLPPISDMNAELNAFIGALNAQKEELKLL